MGPKRTSLAVQWLRLLASTAGGAGSVPGGRTRSHMLGSVAKKKKKTQAKQSVVCVAIDRKKFKSQTLFFYLWISCCSSNIC